MPFSKFIVFPVFVAFQAATLILLAPYIKIGPESIGGPALITWISFQAWAMYFLGGCTIKAAGKTVIGYACGIIASVAIFTLNGFLGGYMAGSISLPLAVFIVVIPIMSAERVELLNFIPAWFTLANVSLKHKEYTDAADCFRKVLELQPDNQEAKKGLEECMSKI